MAGYIPRWYARQILFYYTKLDEENSIMEMLLSTDASNVLSPYRSMSFVLGWLSEREHAKKNTKKTAVAVPFNVFTMIQIKFVVKK